MWLQIAHPMRYDTQFMIIPPVMNLVASSTHFCVHSASWSSKSFLAFRRYHAIIGFLLAVLRTMPGMRYKNRTMGRPTMKTLSSLTSRLHAPTANRQGCKLGQGCLGRQAALSRPHTYTQGKHADVRQVEDECHSEAGSERRGEVFHVAIADRVASVFGRTELLRVVHNPVHEKCQSEHRIGQRCEVAQGQHIHRKKDGDVNGQPRPHRGAASAALGLVHLGFLACDLHGTHEGEFGATLGQTGVCEAEGPPLLRLIVRNHAVQ